MTEKRTDNICKVCQGWIIERFRTVFSFSTDREIVEGYHCNSCGIEYHKLPFDAEKEIEKV